MRRLFLCLAGAFSLLLSGGDGLTEPAIAQSPAGGTYITLSGPQVIVPRELPAVAIAGDRQPTREVPLRVPSRPAPGGTGVAAESPDASEQQRKRPIPLPPSHSIPDEISRSPEANTFDIAAASGLQPAASAEILTSFDGLDSADNPFAGTPPDPQLAVGPAHIVEFVNNVGRISDKSGVAIGADFTLASFFAVPAGNDDFDPKIIYDDIHDRFFASYVSVSTSGDGLLHFAVSQTSDPTGVWNVYSSPPYVGQLPDYPGIGVTDDKFTVSSNVFSTASGAFLGEQTVVIEKADLMAGVAPTAFAFAIDHSQFTVRPAHNLTAGADQYLTTFTAEFSCCVNINKITVIKITGTPDAANVTEASAVNLAIISQVSPFDSPTAGPGKIVSGDQRMLEAIWRGESLWSAAGARCRPTGDTADRACIHLIEVETVGTLSVVQDIMFGEPGEYFVFPAIRTDSSGNLYVSFTGTHGGVFASAMVAGRRSTDPPGTMSGTCLLKAGEIEHDPSSLPLPHRWGDYMGAAVDPADASKVWVVGQYAKNDGLVNWGTYIGSMSYGVTGLCPAQPAPPAPIFYVVDTTSNSGALNGCDLLTPGDCSLRGAIDNANASGPQDTISFDIPTSDPGYDGTTYTIDVDTFTLELTSHGTEIDGTTQPGYSGSPIIHLRARDAPTAPVERAAIGIFSSGNSVRGLLVNASAGQSLSWGIYVGEGGGNQLAGDWFGVNAAGSAVEGGTFYSIGLIGVGPGNLVGGTSPGDGNVICHSVLLLGAGENVVQGNVMGPDKTGLVDLPCASGVEMFGAMWNLIGGTSAAARNIISGNADGVYLGAGASDNVVQGNYIGVDATGNVALPNFVSGLTIDPGATFNVIGGPEPGAGNIISGNGTSSPALLREANVWLAGDDNTLQGNRIGSDVDCTVPTAASALNIVAGLVLVGDLNQLIGNVVSGNPDVGVYMRSHWFSPPNRVPEDNVLNGNIIGMSCSGGATLPNSSNGITITDGTGNVIGGAGPGEGNVIAGNDGTDIDLFFSGVSANVVKGNTINLDGNGTPIKMFAQILVSSGAHDNIFGGKGGGDGNLIGCLGSFAPVSVSDSGSVGNSFLGNSYRCATFGPNIFGGYPIDLTSGGNTELAAPILTNVNPPRGSTCPGCEVEIVSHRGSSGPVIDSVVEGWTTADGSGNFELAVTPTGPKIFAAATDTSGNTSEFSACPTGDFDCDFVPDASDPDDDGDGFTDANESGTPLCGPNVNHDAFDAGGTDTRVNDGCPAVGPAELACADTVDDDGDGAFNDGCPQAGTFAEGQFKIGTGSLDPCGNNGWPSELNSAGPGANKIDIADLATFVTGVRKLNTTPGEAGFNSRWDLVPGSGSTKFINIADMAAMITGPTGFPPMLGGVKALGGPACPFAP